MKADVFTGDYMFSNDLIVLFLLTYFTICGRLGLIRDNVVFFIQCDFKWYKFEYSSTTVPKLKVYFLNTMDAVGKKLMPFHTNDDKLLVHIL